MNKQSPDNGFTLVELIAVIAIVAIVAGISVVAFGPHLLPSVNKTANADSTANVTKFVTDWNAVGDTVNQTAQENNFLLTAVNPTDGTTPATIVSATDLTGTPGVNTARTPAQWAAFFGSLSVYDGIAFWNEGKNIVAHSSTADPAHPTVRGPVAATISGNTNDPDFINAFIAYWTTGKGYQRNPGRWAPTQYTPSQIGVAAGKYEMTAAQAATVTSVWYAYTASNATPIVIVTK